MYYPDELINEVVAANDLVDLVSSYVKLSRTGRTYKGLCPFHGEKTPSFHVSAEKQLYHCFGCGAGGSSLQFIMNIENLDFVDGVKLLAQRAKIALPEGDESGETSKAYKKRQRMYEMNAFAARFFNKQLFSEENRAAQQYILERGLDRKTAVKFGLGYAPQSFTALLDGLRGAGYSDAEILQAGLARTSQKNGKLYDFFRNRIMFPIIDVRGNVVAFGGRVMDDSLPKYLNSPDTPVFSKSKTMFALNFAKKACMERLILCEGYMDVIALHKAGFTNAVATLGTAFTEEHARIMARYTPEIVLCHDSDGAGRKATAAALEILKNFNVKTRVLNIKGAKDPDEFIKKNGGEAFKEMLEKSPGETEYKVDTLMKEYDITTADGKIELTNKLAAVFAQMENPIEREVMIKDTAKRLDISSESIFTQVNFIRHNNVKKQRKQEIKDASKVTPRKASFADRREGALAMLLATEKKVYEAYKDKITPEFFEDEAVRSFVTEAFRAYENNLNADIPMLLAKIPSEYAAAVSGFAAGEAEYKDELRAAEEMYEALKAKRGKKDISSADELMNLLERFKQTKNK